MQNKNHGGTPGTKGSGPIFFRKKDMFFIGAILLVAALGFGFWAYGRSGGATAQITVVNGGQATVTSVTLAENQILHINSGVLPVTLEIKDGRIRFINSVCADHRCEGFSWLQHEGDKAICLPAGVWVEIV